MLDHIEIFVPSVTYQYSDAGEISNSQPSSSLKVAADDDLDAFPARFRAWIVARYENHPNAWERLVELIASDLEKLPDNPFVLKDAWLCGLHPDGGPRVASIRTAQARLREEQAGEDAHQAARAKARSDAALGVAAETVSERSDRHQDGKDRTAVVDVRVDGGAPLRFRCREVADVGRVINPAYEIAPGCVGGLAMPPANRGPLASAGRPASAEGLAWHDFKKGQGWSPVRPLTPMEVRAMNYLNAHWPL